MQKSGARVRGIEFRLSYEQWLAIWTESGHLDERGRGPAKYAWRAVATVALTKSAM